jgi:uncharacterized protein
MCDVGFERRSPHFLSAQHPHARPIAAVGQHWTEFDTQLCSRTANLAGMKRFLLCVFLFLSLAAYPQNELTRDLIKAVEQNDLAQVKALLKQGADITQLLPSESPFYLFFLSREMYLSGLTKQMKHEAVFVGAIHANAAHANLKVLKLLLKKRANIDAGDSEGKTPLMYALRSPGGEEYALLLIRKGANYTTVDQAGNTALHYAAFGGNLQGVQMTITGGTPINFPNLEGITPLHAAAVRADLDLLQAMVDLGADLQLRDSAGFSVLHYAAGYGKTDKIKWILAKAPELNAPSTNGFSPMDIARIANNDEAVVALKRAGGQYYHYRYDEMIEALKRRDFDVVKRCLDAGANPNRKGRGDTYPIHIAAELGDNLSTDFLLKAGADPEHINAKGNTALDLALKRGYPNTAIVLLNGGTLCNSAQLAVVMGTMAAQEMPGSWEDVALKMIGSLKDLDIPGGSLNIPPLHYAAYLGHTQLFDALLKGGANPSLPDAQGWTPLHWAVTKRDLLPRQPAKAAIARQLLQLGCPLDLASHVPKELPHTQPYLAKRIPANATALDVFQYALPKDQEMAALLQEAKAKANMQASDFADNGMHFFTAKDYSTAMVELNKALSADPRNAQALFLRGECKRELNLLEEADRDYSEAIRMGATKEAHMARGRTRYDLGRTQLAVADFDYVLKINNQQAEALYWRGKCHIRNGDGAAACDDLRTSAGLGHEAAVTAVKLYCNR